MSWAFQFVDCRDGVVLSRDPALTGRRHHQLPVGRLSSQNLAFLFRMAPPLDCDAVGISECYATVPNLLVGVRVSPSGVRPITLDLPSTGAIIKLASEKN